MYGAPRSLLFLMQYLNSAHQCTLITIGGGGLVDEAESLGIPVTVLESPQAYSSNGIRAAAGWLLRQVRKSVTAFRVAQMARKTRAELVYVNTTFRLSLILGAALSFKPVIVHVREVGNYLAPPRPWRRWLLRKTLDSTSLLICVSGAAQQAAQHTGTGTRSLIVHNGIDAARFQPDPEAVRRIRVQLDVHDDQLLIGMVGKRSTRKGFDTFVQAARSLAEDSRFVFATLGDDDPAFLEAHPDCTPDQLPANVRILNYQRDPEEFFMAMDIFVMASRQEPFARVNLEAAAAGCAIIATSVDGNLEIFRDGENALLFKPADASDLANAIACLGDDTGLRHRLSSQAREDVEQFTLERCHQAIEHEMLKLASREQTD